MTLTMSYSFPLVHHSFIGVSEHTHPNVDRAVSLLMNLSADQISRRQIREAGAVEVLVQVRGRKRKGR